MRIWVVKFLTAPKMLEEMRKEISQKSNGDEGLKERDRIKAKIAGLNSQLDALTERLSMLPKTVSPLSFFKQMEKVELLKVELEKKLMDGNEAASMSINRFVKIETFEKFSESWKYFLTNSNDETKKKLIQKFIRKIEIGKNEITIHWLVDEDYYNSELVLAANSALSEKNLKNVVVFGSHSLINGAL